MSEFVDYIARLPLVSSDGVALRLCGADLDALRKAASAAVGEARPVTFGGLDERYGEAARIADRRDEIFLMAVV